jgi:hypothetical protein
MDEIPTTALSRKSSDGNRNSPLGQDLKLPTGGLKNKLKNSKTLREVDLNWQ